MEMLVNLMHPVKEAEPMLTVLSGIVISSKLEQLRKQLFFIFVIDDGRKTYFNCLHE